MPEPQVTAGFSLREEVSAAAKQWALAVVFVWGIFLAIGWIWDADNGVFWGCLMLFGVLGPLMLLFSSTRAIMRKRRCFLEGFAVGRYIPMFVHRAGLGLPTKNNIDYVVALTSAKELIFYQCEASLCESAKEGFFEDLKKELVRIPLGAIEDVVVFSPEVDTSNRMTDQISEFIVNQTLGRLLHTSSKTVYFDAFLVIVLAGTPKQHIVFGIPNKLSGAPIFDTLLEFMPEAIANPFEILGTTMEGVEALSVEEADPAAIKNAKRVAVEVLVARARSRELARKAA